MITKLSFLLTHLLRGATLFYLLPSIQCSYFYSRTSCEVQHLHLFFSGLHTAISTHAPLARCNCNHCLVLWRPSMISTHAPLVRCNKVTFGYLRELYNFYSRTSCEVQQDFQGIFPCYIYFYSRTSCEVQL